MGWPRPPVPEPPWFESVIPTWSFLYGALVGSADVEIAINGWVDHFLTLTGLYWDDMDQDGVIDEAEEAWMEYVDPWTGAWDTADIWHEGPSILTNYAGGNSFISTAAVETSGTGTLLDSSWRALAFSDLQVLDAGGEDWLELRSST